MFLILICISFYLIPSSTVVLLPIMLRSNLESFYSRYPELTSSSSVLLDVTQFGHMWDCLSSRGSFNQYCGRRCDILLSIGWPQMYEGCSPTVVCALNRGLSLLLSLSTIALPGATFPHGLGTYSNAVLLQATWQSNCGKR